MSVIKFWLRYPDIVRTNSGQRTTSTLIQFFPSGLAKILFCNPIVPTVNRRHSPGFRPVI
jgi:hypothetical protein